MTAQQQTYEADHEAWRVERAFANDPELIGAALSFAADSLAAELASHPERGRIAETAGQLVRELFGNATHHRSPLVRLGLTIDGDVLRIDVENHRRGYPTCRPVLFVAPSDQTVAVMARLATRWDYEPTREGERVWAETDLVEHRA